MIPVRPLLSETLLPLQCLDHINSSQRATVLVSECSCWGLNYHINAGLCFSGLTVLGYSPKTGTLP